MVEAFSIHCFSDVIHQRPRTVSIILIFTLILVFIYSLEHLI